ncbi:MAG: hypothetical protein DWQ07_12895 [Chloroflexi bacterium]|nr:MAG: hypothetical protein DWQ07_12895 [Chloroflexota bacterium]MBL1196937.1 hypothetical protein [Chloroflexota bacterium]NOH14233.1 hypothetical protein [Chloroflexota bacterium]
MDVRKAMLIACMLQERLAPAFKRLEIAGSIRRGKQEVKDIELVGLARFGPLQPDLFADSQTSNQENLTNLEIPSLLEDSGWEIGDKDGPRFKQLVNAQHNINCDLFILHDPMEWGLGFLIRTGPAEFNIKLMSSIQRQDRHVTGNRLHGHPKGERKGKRVECDKGDRCRLIIPTPSEEAVFEALGLPFLPPEERSEERLAAEIGHIGHRFYLPEVA